MTDWPTKPCPFCGSERSQYISEYCLGAFVVRCTCGVEGPTGDTVDEAMEKWNRREGEDELRPCPFCGGTARIDDMHRSTGCDQFRCLCNGCGIGYGGETPEEAAG